MQNIDVRKYYKGFVILNYNRFMGLYIIFKTITLMPDCSNNVK